MTYQMTYDQIAAIIEFVEAKIDVTRTSNRPMHDIEKIIERAEKAESVLWFLLGYNKID